MKRGTKAVAALAALLVASPAYADPISLSIAALAAIGTQTATALAIAVTSFFITTVIGLVVTVAMQVLFGPKQTSQDRQASILTLSIGEGPAAAIFASS